MFNLFTKYFKKAENPLNSFKVRILFADSEFWKNPRMKKIDSITRPNSRIFSEILQMSTAFSWKFAEKII